MIQKKNKNAFPVMKFDYDLNVIYSNSPAQPILNNWNVNMQQSIPAHVLSNHPELNGSKKHSAVKDISLCIDGATIHCSIVAFPEAGYIGLYGYMVEYTEKVHEKIAVSKMN